MQHHEDDQVDGEEGGVGAFLHQEPQFVNDLSLQPHQHVLVPDGIELCRDHPRYELLSLVGRRLCLVLHMLVAIGQIRGPEGEAS